MFLDVSPLPAGGTLILLALAVMGLVAAGILVFVYLLKRRKRRAADARGGASQPSNPNQP